MESKLRYVRDFFYSYGPSFNGDFTKEFKVDCPFIPTHMRITMFSFQRPSGANVQIVLQSRNIKGSRKEHQTLFLTKTTTTELTITHDMIDSTTWRELTNTQRSFNQSFTLLRYLTQGNPGFLDPLENLVGGSHYIGHIQLEYGRFDKTDETKLLEQMKDLSITQTAIMRSLTDMTRQRLEAEERELEEDLMETFEVDKALEPKVAGAETMATDSELPAGAIAGMISPAEMKMKII